MNNVGLDVYNKSLAQRTKNASGWVRWLEPFGWMAQFLLNQKMQYQAALFMGNAADCFMGRDFDKNRVCTAP